MMKRILLVEDDEIISNIIMFYLRKKPDYHVTLAKNAQEALSAAKDIPDIILLDICLPDINGVKLCAKLRETIYCPIIFISCLDDEDTIVKALETGGDDYLTKPFSEKMLETRIEANLRRVKLDQLKDRAKTAQKRILFEDFEINCENHTIIKGGTTVHLAPIEYSILMYFVSNPEKTVSPDELYENIWGSSGYGDVRTVVTHVYNLRKIIETDFGDPKYISNIRGCGYYFNPIRR